MISPDVIEDSNWFLPLGGLSAGPEGYSYFA